MKDLFSEDQQWQQIPLAQADVRYLPCMLLPSSADGIMRQLIDELDWAQPQIKVWGRWHAQPRLMSWHADAGLHYAYSGLSLHPRPWTALLQSLRETVEQQCEQYFNSVLVNYYRDGQDSMGMHSDDEPQLGPQPVIASLSLGEERIFRFKPKDGAGAKTLKLPLSSGSLLLMAGQTQHRWLHGIAKQATACGPRVNLTFRRVVELA